MSSSSYDKYKSGKRSNVDNMELSDKEFYAELEEGDPVEEGTDILTSLTGQSKK